MKKIASLLILLAAALTLFDACKPEQDLTPKKGNAIFSLSQKARNTNGRTEETPVPAAVLLSIKDVSGTFLHENKKLALYGLGQGYVSESLELPAGKYSLTQFAILDAAGKIIYATPLEGSDLAHYVNDPLPVEFTITENESTKVVPQVLPVLEEDKPESFGYASFGFEVVNLPDVSIKIKVKFAYGNVMYDGVSADLFIEGTTNGKTNYTKNLVLTPGLNELQLNKLSDKYILKTHKWTLTKTISVTKDDLLMNNEVVVTLEAQPKKLKSITEYENQFGNDFVPFSKTNYDYVDGKISQTETLLYDESDQQYKPNLKQTYEWIGNQVTKNKVYLIGSAFYGGKPVFEHSFQYLANGNLHKDIVNANQLDNPHTKDYQYTISSQIEKITFADGSVKTSVYQLSLGNIIMKSVEKNLSPCSNETFEYDQYPNPFLFLGLPFPEFQSKNNKTKETVLYIGCPLPELYPLSYDYEYNEFGFPSKKTTNYNSSYKKIELYEYY